MRRHGEEFQGDKTDTNAGSNMVDAVKLTAEQRRRLLFEWNATGVDYPREQCVHHLVAAQVCSTPDAIAVEFDGHSLTYAELDARASLLAAKLRDLGVGVDSRVAICAGRSFEAVIGVLGVLKAGGAYVPLDPRYPADRLAFMLEDSKAVALLTLSRLQAEIPFAKPNVLCLDQLDWTAAVGKPLPVVEAGAGPDSLAYVIYTSGSTGQPKGVAMVHRALVNLVSWQNKQPAALPPAARTLQFTSLSFDVSFQEIFATWCSGGTLVLMPEELRYDPAGLWRYLCQQRIHRLFLPFIALQQLADSAGESGSEAVVLKEVITAGEQLQITRKIEALFRRLPGAALHNHYGPSETHVVTAYTLPANVDSWVVLPPIGRPIANTQAYLLDEKLELVPPGEPGELYFGGDCLARGYLDREDLTMQRFIPDPFLQETGARLYRTGDLARYLPDGNLEFLGRRDDQIKIRGYRVELGEIETVLAEHPTVRECAVAAHGEGGDKQLVAYVVAARDQPLDPAELRQFLKGKLADHLVPVRYVKLDGLPLTPSGKVNRRALPKPEATPATTSIRKIEPQTELERSVAAVWREVLQLERVGTEDNFFDLGGNSLMLARVQNSLQAVLQRDVPILSLFQYPTVSALAKFLSVARTSVGKGSGSPPREARRPVAGGRAGYNDGAAAGIAIIGMAGRFPGARNVGEFWRNLCEGRESIRTFTDEELLATGVIPELLKDPAYVRSRAVLDGVDEFDAGFFGYTPRDAETTDPQQRLFLECAWTALEDAACDPARFDGVAGIYAGSSLNTYFLGHVLQDRQSVEDFMRAFQADCYHLLVGNDKDYLATRVAYKLNLRGPAVTIQTGCSTSLVAVSHACAALLSQQCDLALAGGVSVSFPQTRGYLYQEGAIPSADGHCRAFDAEATGTVFGAGVGVVVLKRLSDALAAGDPIYAVIKGTAINNDGSDKVSFSAPSVNGQAEVVALAHAQAGVTADTIGYVEAHGTGTPLGDPIEVAALTQAFRAKTDRKQFCALGSLKTNVGHLESAAGVTGLIKTALAVKSGVIPPSLHFQKPNPKCDFENSPFYVAAQLAEWKNSESPRRAGVSSFGVGGTNAHVILEEPPAAPAAARGLEGNQAQLVVLSARTESALQRLTENLATHLEQNPSLQLADVAYTLQIGRKEFPQRRVLIANDVAEAAAKLKSIDARSVFSGRINPQAPSVVFLFPGQGAQFVGMGRELYHAEPVFKARMDRCCEILAPFLGLDLRAVIYPPEDQESAVPEQLRATSLAQPALFALEYALAGLWQSWGIQPAAMVGHSIGEFVAAVLADVMSLEDGLALVAERGSLMQRLPGGGMLSVRLPEAKVFPMLSGNLSVSVINSPKHCVVSGPQADIALFQQMLEAQEVACKPLRTSHAFHSAMMEPATSPFAERVRQFQLQPARFPIVSTQTGQWIQPTDWTDPDYWARQLRQPVRFSDALATLLKDDGIILLEVGPGQTLTTLALQHPERRKEHLVIASMPPVEKPGELAATRTALGRLWLAGHRVEWDTVAPHQWRRRVSLPSYPFERQRHWLNPPAPAAVDPDQGCAMSVLPLVTKVSPTALLESGVASGIRGGGGRSATGLAEDLISKQLKVMGQQLEALASQTR